MKKQSRLRQFLTNWTWKKGIIGILLALVMVGVSVGAFVWWRLNASIGSITGENVSIFDAARTLLPGQEKELAQTDGRTNIVLLGMRGANDPNGGLLADSVMIFSIDYATNQAALVSIPRDLQVQTPGYSGYTKLNATHALGEETGEGLKTTMAVLSEVTGMDMHYGVSIDFEAFTGIIDALDGVTVNAAEDFYDPNYEGGISVKAGPNEMDSDRAKKYVWARLTTNDFDRSRRQREVMNAIKDKVEEQGAFKNPLFLLDVLNSLDGHIKTTMSVDEMKTALTVIDELNLDDMIEKGYDTSPEGPFTSTTDPVNGYVIIPRAGDWSEFQEDIQGIFGDATESEGADQTTTEETPL